MLNPIQFNVKLLFLWRSHETVCLTINPFIETFLMCYNRNVRILSHDHQNTFTIEVYKHWRHCCCYTLNVKIENAHDNENKISRDFTTMNFSIIILFNLRWIIKLSAIYTERGTYPLNRLCRILRAHLLFPEQKKSSSWGAKVYGVYPISKVQYLYCC